jgi:hypothetical protein
MLEMPYCQGILEPNTFDTDKVTPLLVSARSGQVAVVNIMLNSNAVELQYEMATR